MPSRRSLAYIPTFQGAVHIWGGNSSPALGEAEGRHKACPYLPLIGGQRAGTRPAPTFR